MGRIVYNKEILIEHINEFVKINNKPPTARELQAQGYAGIHSFIKYFGSFKNALIETGVFELREDKHQFYDKEYSDQELLDSLYIYMKNKNKIPTTSVMKKELKPSVATYEKRFGSVYKAMLLIGYDYDKQRSEERLSKRKRMISDYKKLAHKLNKVPTSRDIEYYSRATKKMCAMKTYEEHFGSLHNLQVECGFVSTGISRNKNREELIKDLQMYARQLGRTPNRNDMNAITTIASENKYRSEFGSWTNAVKAAGLKPNGKIYTSINGTTCLSYYELLFTNMLENNSYEFTKEERYKNYIVTDRQFRFDFIVCINGKSHFIEIFGITKNPYYKERTELKKKLCQENGIKLIEIYPFHFQSINEDDIHNMFLSLIN